MLGHRLLSSDNFWSFVSLRTPSAFKIQCMPFVALLNTAVASDMARRTQLLLYEEAAVRGDTIKETHHVVVVNIISFCHGSVLERPLVNALGHVSISVMSAVLAMSEGVMKPGIWLAGLQLRYPGFVRCQI